MMHRYRLLIFDFDGTLADSYPAFERAFREAIPRFGLRAGDELEIGKLRGMGAREIIRYFGIPWWNVPRIAKYVRSRMAEEPLRLFHGTSDALERLHRAGVRLAVVSSNSEANVRAGLGAKLTALFATFACGASLFGKATKFRQVLKRLAVSPEDALAVGDELRDAEAAASAGIDFGAVAWGYTTLEALQRGKPACIFQQPEDLATAASQEPRGATY